MVYKYLGYGVTNENGVAKLEYNSEGQKRDHSYTGVGAGEVDVLASLDNPVSQGSIVSGTYPVWDTIRYDDGTGTVWSPNANASVTMEDDGALFEKTANYGTVYIGSNQQIHPIDTVMEFDVVSETGTCELSFMNSSQSNKGIVNFGNQTNRGVGHWRIEIRNTTVKSFLEGVEISTSPYSVTFGNNPVRVGFAFATGSDTIKIANFKEYYL